MKVISYAKIDSNIKKILKTNKLCLVLKNDAYGFGMGKLVELAKQNQIDYLAVNTIHEAKAVRNLDKQANILLFGPSIKFCADIKKYKIIPTVSNTNEYVTYKKAGVKFAVEIDTGMNRFGFKGIPEDIIADSDTALVYAHFASYGDEEAKMLKNIEMVCKKYHRLCQFGGSMVYSYTDSMLRIGRLLYQNCVSFFGKVIFKKSLKKGEAVGYGGEFVADMDMQIAVLDVGYYNGLKPNYSGYVYHRNNKYKIIGRICMNHTFIIANSLLCVGDYLEFFGDNIPIERFLKSNSMTEYECFLHIK